MENLIKEALAYYDSPERKSYSAQRISNRAGDIVATVEKTLANHDEERDNVLFSWIDDFDKNS